jgi:hypothetical protein
MLTTLFNAKAIFITGFTPVVGHHAGGRVIAAREDCCAQAGKTITTSTVTGRCNLSNVGSMVWLIQTLNSVYLVVVV